MSEQANFYSANRNKLKQIALEQGIETLLIAGSSLIQVSADRSYPFEQDGSFFYLTGVDQPGASLLITGDKEYLAFSQRSDARKAFEGDVSQQAISEVSGIANVISNEELWELVKSSQPKRVAMLTADTSYIESIDMFINPARKHLIDNLKIHLKEVEIVDIRKQLASLRMIKNEYEIEMTQKAVDASIELFDELYKLLPSANSESDLLACTLSYAAKKQLKFAYDSIIAGGKNACTLHYVENNQPLDKNELLLLDIGLKFNGYSADITRTVTSNQPSERQAEVYHSVLSVQQTAMSLIKPGVSFKDYEDEVNQAMGAELINLGLISEPTTENIRNYYPHSTSHFLGIDVHDVGDYHSTFQPGMIITVEPGIYIEHESIGVRIEDDILITKTGAEVMTQKLPTASASLKIQI